MLVRPAKPIRQLCCPHCGVPFGQRPLSVEAIEAINHARWRQSVAREMRRQQLTKERNHEAQSRGVGALLRLIWS